MPRVAADAVAFVVAGRNLDAGRTMKRAVADIEGAEGDLAIFDEAQRPARTW